MTLRYDSIEFRAYLAFYAPEDEFCVCSDRLAGTMTLADVAAKYGMSREEVRQTEHRALMAAERMFKEGII